MNFSFSCLDTEEREFREVPVRCYSFSKLSRPDLDEFLDKAKLYLASLLSMNFTDEVKFVLLLGGPGDLYRAMLAYDMKDVPNFLRSAADSIARGQAEW